MKKQTLNTHDINVKAAPWTQSADLRVFKCILPKLYNIYMRAHLEDKRKVEHGNSGVKTIFVEM